MAVSQNGWKVYTTAPSGRCKWITGRVAPGIVEKLFNSFAEDFNNRVEKITVGHSWGWANRPIRGSRSTSNHASGTAIDLNAPKHPLGKSGTFSSSQRAEIQKLLKEYGNVIRWGGNYSGRKDEMHFEINASYASVKRVADKLGKSTGKPSSSNTKKSSSDLTVDKLLGPATAKRLQEFLNSKNKTKITVDKKLGNSSFKALQTFLKSKYKDGKISSQATSAKYVGSAIVEGWENKGKAAKGSPTVKSLQKWVGAKPDGFWGRETTGKLQKKLNSLKK